MSTEKMALLLIVFGTAVTRAEKAYRLLESRICAAYPGLPFLTAYCSSRVIRKLRDSGRNVPNVEEALERFSAEGVQKVLAFPAFLAMGEEFAGIECLLSGWERKMKIVYPLPPLANPETLRRFVSALARTLPERFEAGRGLLFMGHGHEDGRTDFAYTALERELQKRISGVFVACVEGSLTLENAIRRMKDAGIRHVTLRPLMIVAGDHAVNDLAGAEEDSWKSRLAASGFSTDEELKGLCEYQEIADFFAEGLKDETR